MKKLFWGALFLALVIAVPAPTMAQVGINARIALPPPIVFAAPPELIVLPDTYVYAVPDVDADIFFYNGWWWRPWDGRWYRSRYYNRGWSYYNTVPSFYFDIDPGWRGYYRDRNWYGHRWDYERIPSRRLQQNWKGWQNNRQWERRGTWGVQNYKPRPIKQRQELRQQRQQQYQQRPEVRQHQQQRQPQVRQQQRQPQVQQPRHKPQQVQQPQRQEQKPEVHQQRQPQVQQPRHEPQQVQQPQRQEQRPEVRKPQRAQPQEKPERDKDEKHDRR